VGDCGDPDCGLGHGRGKLGLGQGLGQGLGALTGWLHQQKVDYFVGPGGPVPITPGYVPYVVVTRSPRDYFSFPPRNPNDP
jgi:hypothetical protein